MKRYGKIPKQILNYVKLSFFGLNTSFHIPSVTRLLDSLEIRLKLKIFFKPVFLDIERTFNKLHCRPNNNRKSFNMKYHSKLSKKFLWSEILQGKQKN